MPSKSRISNSVTTGRNILLSGALVLLQGLLALPSICQTGTGSSPRVDFVKCWPTAGQKSDKRVKTIFNRVVLGKRPPVLSNPVSILADNPDAFLVADQGNRILLRVEKGVGEMPQSLKKSNLDFSSLVGICRGPGSGVLFSDSHAGKIYLLSGDGKEVSILNDSLLLGQPTGIAWSPASREIWVVETSAHRLAVLDEQGRLLRRVGSRGEGEGQFNFPTHIWIDSEGLVYVVDAMNFRVQVLDAAGTVLSVFGKAGDATGYMARPKGIATDSFGNIYVVDALFHAVQVFNRQGQFLYAFGNQGRGDGEFWLPTGITIDDRNNIYVADSYNSRIQVFTLFYPGKQ
jgi:hypothetical protein